MICPECKADIPEGKRFCTSCGAPLESGVAAPPAGRTLRARKWVAAHRGASVVIAATAAAVIVTAVLVTVLVSRSQRTKELEEAAHSSLVRAREYQEQEKEHSEEAKRLAAEATREAKKVEGLEAAVESAGSPEEKALRAMEATEVANNVLKLARQAALVADKAIVANMNSLYCTADYIEAKLELGDISGDRFEEVVAVTGDARAKIAAAKSAERESEKKTREAIEAAIETDKQIKIAFKAKEKASKSKDPADEKAAAEETDRVRLLYARSEIAYDGSLKSEDAMKEKVKIAQEAMLKAQELFEQIGSGRDDG